MLEICCNLDPCNKCNKRMNQKCELRLAWFYLAWHDTEIGLVAL